MSAPADQATTQDAVCYQAASLLLAYPDEELVSRLPLIREALAGTAFAEYFEPTLAHLDTTPLVEAQSFHVQEFDVSRRHALHLSYWTDGDTRRRGEVLAGIKQVYRDSGLLVRLDGELPDHLPLLLEFAAIGDPERGRQLLITYRASLELLRLQLEKDELPQAGILQAIVSTLPGASPKTYAEVQALHDAARPVETVGLDGYGAGPSDLGMPTARPVEPAPAPAPAAPPARPRGLLARLTSRKENQ
ncbi:MAG TPA: nitrate reductase molybdenum cofactor assembly chaperone [Candidatus Luteococcus avicola]|nr:nitrate reductase molybdenum cofactor assembly chaperone [Candidatus Luteococcus avicola]